MDGVPGNELCLDIESLHPAAMAFFDQLHGNTFKGNKGNRDRLGGYYCRATAHRQANHEFFPIGHNNEAVKKTKSKWSCRI